jgi:hypothetical protein
MLSNAGTSSSHTDFASVFTNAKAGMEDLSAKDKERIKKVGQGTFPMACTTHCAPSTLHHLQIIYDMSKDSAHFKNEQRKQAQVEAKIMALQERAARLSAVELSKHQR